MKKIIRKFLEKNIAIKNGYLYNEDCKNSLDIKYKKIQNRINFILKYRFIDKPFIKIKGKEKKDKKSFK